MLIDNTVAITTWDDALNALDDIEDPPPDALSWASAHWDDASTRLVGRLRRFAAGRRDSGSGGEAFYIAHLCGENGETRAYPILCRLIGEDGRIAEWLDDAVTETLPGILIRVFDGDAVLLRRAIESERGDEFARASALAALGYLVRARGAMSDDDMRGFLRKNPPRHGPASRIDPVADLGDDCREPRLPGHARGGRRAQARNFVPDDDFNGEDFDLRIGLAQSDASGLAGFERDRVAPLIDATSALLSLPGAEAAAAGRRLRALAQKAGDNRL